MTVPLGEQSDAKNIRKNRFKGDQLLRRPTPIPPKANTSGWTVALGDGETEVVVGDYQEIWKVPRQIVSDRGDDEPWYIYDPSASLKEASSSGDIEIWLYRVRTNGTIVLAVSSLLDDPLVIDSGTLDSRVSGSPVVVTQFANLVDYDPGPNYDSIMIGIDSAGTGAKGLSIDIPIGKERVEGSGYR